MRRVCAPVVAIATASYAASVAVGVASALGLDPKRYYRDVHHVFYITTMATTAAATSFTVRKGRAGRSLAPALVPLGLLPFIGSSHRPWHAGLALSAAPFYGRTLRAQLRSGSCNY